jgi:hypothetical protein
MEVTAEADGAFWHFFVGHIKPFCTKTFVGQRGRRKLAQSQLKKRFSVGFSLTSVGYSNSCSGSNTESGWLQVRTWELGWCQPPMLEQPATTQAGPCRDSRHVNCWSTHIDGPCICVFPNNWVFWVKCPRAILNTECLSNHHEHSELLDRTLR